MADDSDVLDALAKEIDPTDAKAVAAAPVVLARRAVRRWARRRWLGKCLNLLRLVKASTTFEGAARYAAWKIERHTGLPLEVTPLNERFPLLAAPRVLWALWRHRRSQKNA